MLFEITPKPLYIGNHLARISARFISNLRTLSSRRMHQSAASRSNWTGGGSWGSLRTHPWSQRISGEAMPRRRSLGSLSRHRQPPWSHPPPRWTQGEYPLCPHTVLGQKTLAVTPRGARSGAPTSSCGGAMAAVIPVSQHRGPQQLNGSLRPSSP
jgi:hypothetical protein